MWRFQLEWQVLFLLESWGQNKYQADDRQLFIDSVVRVNYNRDSGDQRNYYRLVERRKLFFH